VAVVLILAGLKACGTDQNHRALCITGNAPRIDGSLDDDAWHVAEIAEGLVQ
jgi:hypothetical protein